MMPVKPRPAPADAELAKCIRKYRGQARHEDVEAVWKAFRASACGKAWFGALAKAYGHRCLYCDHAPGRHIDHAIAKSKSEAGAFAWKNFRPCCGDCNQRKGTRRIVDPVHEDPRTFVVYDVATGKPGGSPAAGARRRTKSEHTIVLLDNQTLNDFRRAKLRSVLDTLARFLAGEAGYDAARVRAELAEAEPHRAIVRDLILGAVDDAHVWSPLVRKALKRLPGLKDWAVAPLGKRAVPT